MDNLLYQPLTYLAAVHRSPSVSASASVGAFEGSHSYSITFERFERQERSDETLRRFRMRCPARSNEEQLFNRLGDQRFKPFVPGGTA